MLVVILFNVEIKSTFFQILKLSSSYALKNMIPRLSHLKGVSVLKYFDEV